MSIVPEKQAHPEFESIEDINNYLLQHKDVIDSIKARDGDAKFVFLMFDEKTEKLVKEIGGEVWFPKASLRKSRGQQDRNGTHWQQGRRAERTERAGND